MKLLIFDTETTGLPRNSKTPAIVERNNWPHLVSISWVILDRDTNLIIKQREYLIRPESWVIPQESTKIHGITDVAARLRGVSLRSVMNEFMAEECDRLVAHNLNFDRNVVINAIQWDLGIPFTGFKVSHFDCTMYNSRDFCKLPGAYGYKLPKLSELYEFIFKRKPNEKNLHGSLYDTLILAQCIQTSDLLRSTMDLPPRSTITFNEVYNKSTEVGRGY